MMEQQNHIHQNQSVNLRLIDGIVEENKIEKVFIFSITFLSLIVFVLFLSFCQLLWFLVSVKKNKF